MPQLLQEWVSAHARQRPDAVAIAHKTSTTTYARLDEESNRLARALQRAGCQKGDRVALLLERSDQAILGILAALKADCSYVPLDLRSPVDRISRALSVCTPRLLIADESAAELLGQLAAAAELPGEVVWLGASPPPDGLRKPALTTESWADNSPESLTYRNASSDPAYIMFTSGSTGAPKGVAITHANVVHAVNWAIEEMQLSAADHVAGQNPLSFDLSTFDIFIALATGGRLCIAPPELNARLAELLEFLEEEKISFWVCVPSILNVLARFRALEKCAFPNLRHVVFIGEVLPTPTLIYWMQRLPHVAFHNQYGPTETTVVSTNYTIPGCPEDELAPIPIGHPCEGERLLLLDENMQPVPQGEIGELYIGGAGVSPGYWGDEEKTKAAFLPDPESADEAARIYKTGDLARLGEDGLYYFLGRKDYQIKSRGYRIELGEIENALHALDELEEGAVVAIRANQITEKIICCAYTPRADVELAPRQLRKLLVPILPDYMLPVRWLRLERLPQTSNGKVDRRQLQELFTRKNEA